VASFLSWINMTGIPFWNYVIVTVVLVTLVSILHKIPAVERAGAELGAKQPTRSPKNFYLTLPSAFYLAVGYAFNQVVTFVVDAAVAALDPDESTTGQTAATVFKVVFQVIYFVFMSMAVVGFDSWYATKKQANLKKEQDADDDQDWVSAFEHEVTTDVGNTITHALAFVYGWGISDTLKVIYYPFFHGCSTWSTCPLPQYPIVWYFAILCTIILGSFMKQISMQEYRSAHSKSYRTLMITGTGLTVGWAWMDVCQSTTSFFVDEWKKKHDEPWQTVVIYLAVLLFVYFLMAELYFQILDEMRFVKRERDEFHTAYPTVPATAFSDLEENFESANSEVHAHARV